MTELEKAQAEIARLRAALENVYAEFHNESLDAKRAGKKSGTLIFALDGAMIQEIRAALGGDGK